ncbi:uncharacterized protein LOC132314342 [Cornus florida]|uniref:uncharacterized protein LOC132314342 n=1 Tax=Cornus florida TaxID=4283 RepID=UPI0028985A04|nr:uncharacterized protein LOC132314342 [Cornus florida]
MGDASILPVPPSSSHWSPPPMGIVKCNVNASFSLSNQVGGGGAVFRNSQGQILQSVCYDQVWFECDSLLVVQAINGVDGGSVEIHALSFDVQVLLEQFSFSCLSHVRQHSNEVAHALAKLSRPHITSDIALVHTPGDILDLAAKDYLC